MNTLLSRLLATLFVATLGSSAGAAPKPPQDSAHSPAQTCLQPAAWTMLDGTGPRLASGTWVLMEMAKRDVVLLGEHHGEEDHHRWQAQALAALLAHRPNMVIGFEMFPRRVQPALDRWVAGELTVKEFLEQSEWDKVWNMQPELYLPLFQFARINRIPMVALNVDHKLNQAIAEKGWDAIPEAEREGVGRAAPPPEPYRNYLLEVYHHHSAMRGAAGAQAKKKTDGAFSRFVQSQITWDRAMAEALSRRLPADTVAERPLVVGIMGSGHIRFGYGVPHQLRDLGVKRIGSLIPVAADSECTDIRPGLADAVFALPRTASTPPQPPRLGVRLEQGEDGVRIVEVLADSLAERSGLKTGDRLLEVAGQPAKRVMPVTASIRQHPGGGWLPLRVRRGDQMLELVVKFPATP